MNKLSLFLLFTFITLLSNSTFFANEQNLQSNLPIAQLEKIVQKDFNHKSFSIIDCAMYSFLGGSWLYLFNSRKPCDQVSFWIITAIAAYLYTEHKKTSKSEDLAKLKDLVNDKNI